jgi:hypothetical protein
MIGGVAAFLSQPSRYYSPWITVIAFVLPFVAMIALELVGVLPRTVHFDHGSLVLSSRLVDLGPITTAVVLALALLTQLLNTLLVATSRNRAQLSAAQMVHAQSWHLKQLLPGLDREKR